MQLGKERTDVFRYKHCSVTECSARTAGSFGSCLSYRSMGYLSYLINSKISGFSRSLFFMRSFMAVMMLFALSSAPCFELFSAAPAKSYSYILCIKYMKWECILFVCPLVRRLRPRKVQGMFTFCIQKRMLIGRKFIFVHNGYIRLKDNFLKLYATLRSVSKASSAIRQSVGRSVTRLISQPIGHFFEESVSHSNSVTNTANH